MQCLLLREKNEHVSEAEQEKHDSRNFFFFQCWLVTWSFALQVGYEMCPYSSGVFWCRQGRYSRICLSRKTYCWNAGHLLCKGQSLNYTYKLFWDNVNADKQPSMPTRTQTTLQPLESTSSLSEDRHRQVCWPWIVMGHLDNTHRLKSQENKH